MAIKTKYTKPTNSTLEVTSGMLLPEFAKSAVFTLGQDYVYNGCYGQVTAVSVTKTKGIAVFVIYENATKSVVLSSQNHTFEYDLEGPNALTQAYNHIKSLPEFAGSFDC